MLKNEHPNYKNFVFFYLVDNFCSATLESLSIDIFQTERLFGGLDISNPFAFSALYEGISLFNCLANILLEKEERIILGF